ncbi:MAG: hypothetical protein ABIK89_17550 [Planctomycetota bacterium]
MCGLACQNRSIAWGDFTFVAAFALALAVCLSDGDAKTGRMGRCSSPSCGQQETAAEDANLILDWATPFSRRPQPLPEAGLAEYSSPVTLRSEDREPSLSWGAKVGPRGYRLPKPRHHFDVPGQVRPRRSLQVLFSRWVV